VGGYRQLALTLPLGLVEMERLAFPFLARFQTSLLAASVGDGRGAEEMAVAP